MVTDHINYLTFEDPGAVHTVRRALKLAHAGDLYGAAETAGVDVAHAAVVGESLRRGMRFSIGAEVDNDPRARPDAQNIVDAMRPDGIIRSVHFLPIDHPEKGADYMWPYDNPEFAYLFDHVGVDKIWELYTARLFDDIEKLPGHIVGHFYRPAILGHWPDEKKLEAYEDRLLDLAHARGMAVEINTRQIYRADSEEHRAKYIAANKRLMRKAHARGVGIAIGSDAHSPKDQGGAFDVVLQHARRVRNQRSRVPGRRTSRARRAARNPRASRSARPACARTGTAGQQHQRLQPRRTRSSRSTRTRLACSRKRESPRRGAKEASEQSGAHDQETRRRANAQVNVEAHSRIGRFVKGCVGKEGRAAEKSCAAAGKESRTREKNGTAGRKESCAREGSSGEDGRVCEESGRACEDGGASEKSGTREKSGTSEKSGSREKGRAREESGTREETRTRKESRTR